MNCSKVQEFLSAYHDGEIPSEEQLSVAQHLEGCVECARGLEELEQLSRLSRELVSPQAGPELWTTLEAKLDAMAGRERLSLTGAGSQLAAKLATLAALLLIAVGSGVVAYWSVPDAKQTAPVLAVNLSGYLDAFERNPAEAPEVFIARYEGRLAELGEAAKRVQFRSVAAERLPQGFSLDTVYLLKMECCTGIETVYKRKGSEVLAILQHTTEQAVWFGERPVVTVRVNGRDTKIVEVDGRLAATWEANDSYVSVIGVQDVGELTRLVAYLDRVSQEH